MTKLLPILFFSILLSAEMEVDGNLKVTGTIQASTIDSLLSLIAQLEMRIAQLECQNTGIIPDGYCDCFFHTLDECGVCDGDTTSCQDCAGVPNGESLEDMCGTCDTDSSNDCVQDCNGEWGGTAEYDTCGDCGGDAVSEDECYLTDIDGNTYEIVEIGNQTWMAENLKTTRYKNGNDIGSGGSPYPSNSNDGSDVSETICGSDCSEVFGQLYDFWTIVDPSGVCMEGWHVPSDNDWKELEIMLGMSQSTAELEGWRGTNQGSILAGNMSLWSIIYSNELLVSDPQFGESGFDVLPSGFYNVISGNFHNIGYLTHLWSSTIHSTDHTRSYRRVFQVNNTAINRGTSSNNDKNAVRCIKD